MGYYTRVFCTSHDVPSLNEVIGWIKDEYGYEIKLAEQVEGNWSEAGLIYKDGKQPLEIECNKDDEEESLCKEECGEFIEKLGGGFLPLSAKNKVIKHLKNTKFIICSRLLSDVDDDGYNTNAAFLEFFAKKCNGIVQADGEGFYNCGKLAVKLN